MLTPEQLQTWRDDGYLVIPGFYTQEESGQMIGRAKELLNEFDPSDHPLTTFKTGNDHVGDDYFINSNDKIRYFLEPSSLSTPPEGSSEPPKLLVPPSQSINKIGHALAVLDPVFRKYTLEDGRIRDVAKDLGHFKSAKVLQSMIICKQPRIGGVVPCHNDSTFLYTDPPSAVGAWIALEDCTPANGCLSFLPGSHKLARISSRFVKDPKGHGTTFEPVPGVEENEEKWDEMPGWKEAACPAGTLVLIHGSVMHKSPPNPSEKTRMIYTFHMIEGEGAVYDGKNWLQPTSEMPFPALF